MFDLLTYDNEGRPRLTVTVENKTPTLAVFTAQNGFPPATNYATRDVRGVIPVLDFDSSTSESIYFHGIMPKQYQGNGINAYITFTSDATSGDVDWDLAFDVIGAEGIDIDSAHVFTHVLSSNDNTVPSTSGQASVATISFTVPYSDNVSAGDLFLLKLSRDITDTSSGDANFIALELRGQ